MCCSLHGLLREISRDITALCVVFVVVLKHAKLLCAVELKRERLVMSLCRVRILMNAAFNRRYFIIITFCRLYHSISLLITDCCVLPAFVLNVMSVYHLWVQNASAPKASKIWSLEKFTHEVFGLRYQSISVSNTWKPRNSAVCRESSTALIMCDIFTAWKKMW